MTWSDVKIRLNKKLATKLAMDWPQNPKLLILKVFLGWPMGLEGELDTGVE